MRGVYLSILAATAVNALPQSLSDAAGLLELFTNSVKFGPAPTGCSKYELIIGKVFQVSRNEKNLTNYK